MKQIELFEAGLLAQPVKAAAAAPPSAPARVRRYLLEDLTYLRGAEVPPWGEREMTYRGGDFAALADELGPDEASEWKARWDAEIARLRAARAVA